VGHTQAPEAAKNPAKPSSKWDVYSFGAVFLELVAGRALTSVELWTGGGGLEVQGQQAFLLTGRRCVGRWKKERRRLRVARG
jgi:hypothetical protein